jgi:hypothetical protein
MGMMTPAPRRLVKRIRTMENNRFLSILAPLLVVFKLGFCGFDRE